MSDITKFNGGKAFEAKKATDYESIVERIDAPRIIEAGTADEEPVDTGGTDTERKRLDAERKRNLRALRNKLSPERGKSPEFIAGIFPRGCVSIIAGQQGSGKSLLIQKLCMDLSIGGEILDGVTNYAPQKRIVFFVGELPKTTMDDRARLCGWTHEDENFIMYSRLDAAQQELALDLSDLDGVENITYIVEDERPDLVVFDTMMSFSTDDESDMKAMQKLFTRLLRIADKFKVAVVLCHHIRKRKSVERACRLHLDDIVGSGIITRNAALAIGCESFKTQDGEDMVIVSSLKSWYAPLREFSFIIKRDENTNILRGIEIDLDPKLPAHNKTQNIENAVFLQRKPGDKFTAAAIVAVTGASKALVTRVLGAMVEEKKLKKEGTGRDTAYSIMEK